MRKEEEYGDNALITASHSDNVELVKLLIEKGADIHAVDMVNYNALMWALSNGHLEIVKLLIDQGANINDIFQIEDRKIERVIQCIKTLNHEVEERKHLFTEKNLKKWKRLRLASLFN